MALTNIRNISINRKIKVDGFIVVTLTGLMSCTKQAFHNNTTLISVVEIQKPRIMVQSVLQTRMVF